MTTANALSITRKGQRAMRSLFALSARDREKLKRLVRKHSVVLDSIFLACVVGVIVLLGFYAELLGGLVARFIE